MPLEASSAVHDLLLVDNGVVLNHRNVCRKHSDSRKRKRISLELPDHQEQLQRRLVVCQHLHITGCLAATFL